MGHGGRQPAADAGQHAAIDMNHQGFPATATTTTVCEGNRGRARTGASANYCYYLGPSCAPCMPAVTWPAGRSPGAHGWQSVLAAASRACKCAAQSLRSQPYSRPRVRLPSRAQAPPSSSPVSPARSRPTCAQPHTASSQLPPPHCNQPTAFWRVLARCTH